MCWAHVKGHSGHRWNDVADALADAGCRGEELGFAQGRPLAAPEAPPPLVSDVPRYVWHAMRAVAVELSSSGEVVVSSSFLDRSRITRADVAYVGPGEWLPLREPPRGDPGWDLFCAARSARAQELMCHFRPQAIVFEAEGRDADEACDRVAELVGAGVGQPVVELLLPADMGDWDRRVACGRCMRAIACEDVVEAPPGWSPPGGGEVEWEEWEEEDEGGWDSASQPPEQAAARPPTPVKTYGEREGGGPVVFWPRRVPLEQPAAVGTAFGSVGAASTGVRAAPAGVSAAPAGVRAVPAGVGEASAGVVVVPPPADAVGEAPAAPRAFAGWGADGRELSHVLLPARVCRPAPLRAADVPRAPPSLSLAQVPCARACTTDELGDDDVRSVRELAREFARGGVGRGSAGGWVGMARDCWHRFASAAPRPLELPSLARLYALARAVLHPPD